jgi:general stress protein YciG
MNCTAKKKSGEPCGAVAVEGALCAFHRDPERAAGLGRKSGQSRRRMPAADQNNYELKPPRTAKEVRDALGDAMSDLRAGRLDPKTANTLGYLAGVLLSSIEHSDIADRLAALESAQPDGLVRHNVEPGGIQ